MMISKRRLASYAAMSAWLDSLSNKDWEKGEKLALLHEKIYLAEACKTANALIIAVMTVCGFVGIFLFASFLSEVPAWWRPVACFTWLAFCMALMYVWGRCEIWLAGNALRAKMDDADYRRLQSDFWDKVYDEPFRASKARTEE